jgi:hypothetical protein
VSDVLVQLAVGPVLVVAATIAGWRWGQGVGGLVSATPAIVGPVLLIGAHRHGPAFAARTASGTLVGLAALSAFAVVYGRTSRRSSWPASLTAGWVAAAVVGAIAGSLDAGLPVGLAVAVLSLALARRGIPAGAPASPRRGSLAELALRAALTVVLIVALAAAADRLGPGPGGVLAALPVLASILSTFTHAQNGGPAASQLLRGMIGGMAGFVVFCAVVAALVVQAGVAVTFTVAVAAAIAAHAIALVAGAGGDRRTVVPFG